MADQTPYANHKHAPAFIGCGWCNLRVQGCRCTTSCGVAHCDAETVSRPPAVRRG